MQNLPYNISNRNWDQSSMVGKHSFFTYFLEKSKMAVSFDSHTVMYQQSLHRLSCQTHQVVQNQIYRIFLP